MTPKERSAMQQALEALHAELEAGTCEEFENAAEKCYEAITALREALSEQAEQEPVGWVEVERRIPMFMGFAKDYEPEFGNGILPLYAAPVRTKDLTDDELAGACGWKLGDPMYEWVVDIGRWAIAADREKNK